MTENNEEKKEILELAFSIISLIILALIIVFTIVRLITIAKEEVKVATSISIDDDIDSDDVLNMIRDRKMKCRYKVSFTNDTQYAVVISDVIYNQLDKSQYIDGYIIKHKYRIQFGDRDENSDDQYENQIITIPPGGAVDGYISYNLPLSDESAAKLVACLNESVTSEQIYRVISEQIGYFYDRDKLSFEGNEYADLSMIEYKFQKYNKPIKNRYCVVGFRYSEPKSSTKITAQAINSSFVTDTVKCDEIPFDLNQNNISEEPLSQEDIDEVVDYINQNSNKKIKRSSSLDKIAYYVCKNEAVAFQNNENFDIFQGNELSGYTGHDINYITFSTGSSVQDISKTLFEAEYNKSLFEDNYLGVSVLRLSDNKYVVAIVSSDVE